MTVAMMKAINLMLKLPQKRLSRLSLNSLDTANGIESATNSHFKFGTYQKTNRKIKRIKPNKRSIFLTKVGETLFFQTFHQSSPLLLRGLKRAAMFPVVC